MASLVIIVLFLLHGVVSNFVSDVTKVNNANSQERYIQRLQMHSEEHRNNLVLKRIHKARRRNATCMDGSDARYYLSRQWDSSNWVIHLQGGGSCITQEDCRKRSEGPLGSSIPLDDRITGEWTLSNDPKINPTFYRWNKVFITYCSGDVFVGRRLRKDHPYRLPMLGHYIFTTVIEDLVRLHKINTKITKILFGGTSAGGVGVLANADYLQEMTYPAEVKSYNDGGWFTLFPSFGEARNNGLPKFFNTFATLFEKHWDGFADVSCRKQMPKAAACLYGELAIQYVKTPMFVMSSLWDLYQLTQMVTKHFKPIQLPPRTKEEVYFLSLYGNNSHRSVSRLLLDRKNGIFSPACFSHIFFTNCIDGIICGYPRKTIYSSGGQSAYGALTEWFDSDGDDGSYIDNIIKTSSCNPSCCTSHCHQCSTVNEILSRERTNLLHRKREKQKEEKDEIDNYIDEHDYVNQPIVYYAAATGNLYSSVIILTLSIVLQFILLR